MSNRFEEYNRQFKDDLFKDIYARLVNHRTFCSINAFDHSAIEADPFAYKIVAATQWRPIETAPKDEEILVWNKEMKRRAWTVIWSDEYGAFVSSQTYFLFKGDFTHWMPLPKPPCV